MPDDDKWMPVSARCSWSCRGGVSRHGPQCFPHPIRCRGFFCPQSRSFIFLRRTERSFQWHGQHAALTRRSLAAQLQQTRKRGKGTIESRYFFCTEQSNLSFPFMYHMPSFLRCGALPPSLIRLIRFHGVCLSGSLRLLAGGCGGDCSGGSGGSWRRWPRQTWGDWGATVLLRQALQHPRRRRAVGAHRVEQGEISPRFVRSAEPNSFFCDIYQYVSVCINIKQTA